MHQSCCGLVCIACNLRHSIQSVRSTTQAHDGMQFESVQRRHICCLHNEDAQAKEVGPLKHAMGYNENRLSPLTRGKKIGAGIRLLSTMPTPAQKLNMCGGMCAALTTSVFASAPNTPLQTAPAPANTLPTTTVMAHGQSTATSWRQLTHEKSIAAGITKVRWKVQVPSTQVHIRRAHVLSTQIMASGDAQM